MLKANTPIWWGGPCKPQGEVSPQNKALLCKPTQRATFVCWLLLNCLSYYPHLVGWTLLAQGWSEPPKTEIYQANPPEEQLLFAVPHPIIEADTLIWWGGPCGLLVGVSPPELNFTKQTHPKEQILFAGPGPILIANTSIWWSRPCGLGDGVNPPNSNFQSKPTLRSNVFWTLPYY